MPRRGHREQTTHLTMTISSSPGSFMYAGSECVEIWLGVRLVLLGRRPRFVPAFAAVVLFPFLFPLPLLTSWSAVSSRMPGTAVPVATPAAWATPPPRLKSAVRRKRRPQQAKMVPTTKSAATATSGIFECTQRHGRSSR